MKNINKIIRTASVGAALAVVFTIAFAAAPKADACYSFYSGCGGYGNSYSYNTPYYYQNRNVYVQPQVVYQQPQVIYQQQPVVYQQPTYAYNYQTYSPLSVNCYANTSTVSPGQTVTWNAYTSGGNGVYTYSWSGTDNPSYSGGSTAYSTYYNPGSYSVTVTVYSNGQSATQTCGFVAVSGGYYSYAQPTTYAYVQPTTYNQTVVQQPNGNNNGGMVAACFADRTTAQIGTPVTWSVEVTGGGTYTYQWSGTDGLSGTGASAVQAYNTVGTKNAAVLITSNGQTISQACGDSVSVRSYVSPATTNYQGTPAQTAPATSATNATPLSANALFSLGNIPWGWIAILIIIVLIVAVFYLLFNRHKV